MNLAVLIGHLSSPAQVRTLESGSTLVSLHVTVAGEPGQRADSIPVAWFDPPAWAADLDEGEQVVVVGRVRRRFFGRPVTQTRTEVVAESVVKARRTKQAAALVDRALGRLDDAVRIEAPAC